MKALKAFYAKELGGMRRMVSEWLLDRPQGRQDARFQEGS